MSERILSLPAYVAEAFTRCPALADFAAPWDMTAHAADAVRAMLRRMGSEFVIVGEVGVHRNAVVEAGAVICGPAVVSEGCVVAAHAYLRDGVFPDRDVRVGPSCEIKASFVFQGSVLAHLNYVGNSLIGGGVNLEAGAVLANHFNERADKRISVVVGERILTIGVEKFGALVGDGSRIGANAVTTPGTILPPRSIVGRLTLVDQVADQKAGR
jgi:UDP-N-acetylglucosamine diphosphorylase / glucose-1-phosphate thymidylyltransferase / UDP-N-acetylgalactosamine diphosphorylase / glucosamine-1-phosphate N-acetyltransferase / galactosamine-1-phosphate N-acetyltransferase